MEIFKQNYSINFDETRDHQKELFTLFFIILEWYLKKKQLRDWLIKAQR